MIQSSPEEAIATQYFSQANGTVAFLLLSLGYTALQFEHPEPFAWLVITISMIWLFSIGGPYRSILNAYLPKGAPASRYIFIIWRLKIFIISLGFALAIALGLNTDGIYSLLGYPST
ncbi:hypothetical protein N5F00_08645 [Pseudomonas chengduensis]|nr:hypothetical protein [Pseudomonas chengduensis]MDH1729553.1 hypothetical protein [Pseudomonas chengduensis]